MAETKQDMSWCLPLHHCPPTSSLLTERTFSRTNGLHTQLLPSHSSRTAGPHLAARLILPSPRQYLHQSCSCSEAHFGNRLPFPPSWETVEARAGAGEGAERRGTWRDRRVGDAAAIVVISHTESSAPGQRVYDLPREEAHESPTPSCCLPNLSPSSSPWSHLLKPYSGLTPGISQEPGWKKQQAILH